MTRTRLIVAVAIVLTSFDRPQAQDNPQASSGSWRPTIVAQHGMVAAGHPLSGEAGGRILQARGNAVDAPNATGAGQGEGEARETGPRADPVVLFHNAKKPQVKIIN